MDKDYKLAEHLIAHLQQDDVLAPMVCPTVWDEQEQIDAINRAAMGRPGSVAVTPAGYVPLLEMGVNAPMVRMHAVLAVSCLRGMPGMPGRRSSPPLPVRHGGADSACRPPLGSGCRPRLLRHSLRSLRRGLRHD